MSDFRAIGATSATLQTLLTDRLDAPPGVQNPPSPIPVTIGIPPEDGNGEETPRVNLFLYRVTRNGYLSNDDIPGRRPRGTSEIHPPLALDLHYLLTPYGSTANQFIHDGTDELVAHYLLGSAMRILNDNAIITRALETSLGQQILDPSLEDAYEHVKITLEPLSLEDVSKVWTAIGRPFRLSAAYEVCVVQIESTAPRRFPQPVGELPKAGPRVVAVPVVAPRIVEVHAANRPGPFAGIGETLVLTGTGLGAQPALATFGEVDVSGAITTAVDDRLTIVVPDDPRLQPGILPVRVAHGVMLGEPPLPHRGPRSNTAAWVLVPTITKVTRNGSQLTIEGTRLFLDGAECATLLGDRVVRSDDYTSSTPEQLTLDVPPGTPVGSGVRVSVNGAESIGVVALPGP
jgi:hypothetical protein